MNVAVLGCSGTMGSFFVKYFLGEGHRVIGFDKKRIGGSRAGFRFSYSNRDAAHGADVVVVAVPIEKTTKVVREVSPFMKEGSTLVEITSVKGKIHEELQKILVPRKVSLLSLHPMFGPYARMENLNICVIGNRRDLPAARRLFPHTRLVLLGSREHDRLIAYVLSLVHLMNLAFVSTLVKGAGVKGFERAASPTGSAQLNLSRAVLSQSPSLVSHIQIGNPFVTEVLSSIMADLDDLKRVIARKDVAGFERRFVALAREFRKAELDRSLRDLYSA